MEKRIAKRKAGKLMAAAVGAAGFMGLGSSHADATLIIDLRATASVGGVIAPGGKSVAVVAGNTVTLGIFARVSGTNGNNADEWLQSVGGFFPVKHFAEAMQATFSPFTIGNGFRWHDLGVIALWALGGTIVAVRRFQWEPRTAGGGGRRRRQSARSGAEG